MLAQSIRDSRKSDDLEASRARDEFVGYPERVGHETEGDWSEDPTLALGKEGYKCGRRDLCIESDDGVFNIRSLDAGHREHNIVLRVRHSLPWRGLSGKRVEVFGL